LSARGLATTWDDVHDQLNVNGTEGVFDDAAQAVEITNMTAGGTGSGTFFAAETVGFDATDDKQQASQVTVGDGTLGPVTIAGEIYRITATPDYGDAIIAEVIADGTETEADLAGKLVTEFNTNAAFAGSPEANWASATAANNVITVTDAALGLSETGPDNGGFALSVEMVTGIQGSGASILLTGADSDLDTADIITDFTAADDSIAFAGLPAGTTGVNGNYDTGAEVPGHDYSDVYNDAVAAMNGTNVIYYLGSIQEDLVDANGNLGHDNTDETVGLLFFDANGDKTPDGVVALIGVDTTSFSHLDIVAG